MAWLCPLGMGVKVLGIFRVLWHAYSYPPDRCMMDTDDEVRDRATFYLNVLQQRQMALNATYIFNGQWEPRV